jgi:hypothetical protein
MGTKSWLREEITSAEVFRADYTTFRSGRFTRVDGVFICVKNSGKYGLTRISRW